LGSTRSGIGAKVYPIRGIDTSGTPSPSVEHQISSIRLIAALLKWVDAHPGDLLLHAPLDVILADGPEETSIVQPDILYLALDRLVLASRRGIEGGPTLAAEILAAGASGPDPIDLPPFTGLGLVPDSLWPTG
jgi:hypothetical protein